MLFASIRARADCNQMHLFETLEKSFFITTLEQPIWYGFCSLFFKLNHIKTNKKMLKHLYMKTFKFLPLLLLFIVASCDTVKVYSDYDKSADFKQYKTFAFLKSGIDKVEISDLDKKRILNAIDQNLQAKGMTKSETPDLLVNIFTKSREQISVNQFNAGWGYGWGYGWNPYMYGGQTTVSSSTEGTLYIDLIDAKKKELVWQGEGIGTLSKDMNEKDAIVNDIVTKILAQFPPASSTAEKKK